MTSSTAKPAAGRLSKARPAHAKNPAHCRPAKAVSTTIMSSCGLVKPQGDPQTRRASATRTSGQRLKRARAAMVAGCSVRLFCSSVCQTAFSAFSAVATSW
jgi:hypothetical protein